MSGIPPEVKAQLERKAAELDLQDSSKIGNVMAVMQRRKDQIYVVNVRLDRTNPEDADYGDVYYRLWKAGEVSEILGSPIFQKNAKNAITGDQLTTAEQKQLFEFRCEQVAKVCKGLTKEELVQAGDWAFVQFMFNFLLERTGVGQRLVEDFDKFFRDGPGQGLRPNLVPDPKKNTE